ncbi:MAG: GyrI-like domain-containing protein [Clostridia bacterium]|nr:GyrI-like domain-containing protein [Clostridia bacterium]
MKIERIEKPAFAVIGKLGATMDGEGFIARLWQAANEHFPEIEPLVKRNENGMPVGFWGAMSDVSLSFQPWEDGFSKGVYLAGAEVRDDAQVPAGWTKWTVPGFVYLRVKADAPDIFPQMLTYLGENDLALAGAVHDFTDPADGQNYMFFPIEKL